MLKKNKNTKKKTSNTLVPWWRLVVGISREGKGWHEQLFGSWSICGEAPAT